MGGKGFGFAKFCFPRFPALSELLGLYRLDGMKGKKDLSPNKAPTAVLRNTRPAPGPDGRPNAATMLMGEPNSYIQIPNNGKLKPRTAITVATWLFHSGRAGTIFSYLRGGIQFLLESRRRLTAKFSIVPGRRVGPKIVTRKIKYKAWSFVAVTYDRTSGIAKLFVNGRTAARKRVGKVLVASAFPVMIGVTPGDARYLRGRVACMQIYSVALNYVQMRRAMKRCIRQSEFDENGVKHTSPYTDETAGVYVHACR